jgi:hypothetical protein
MTCRFSALGCIFVLFVSLQRAFSDMDCPHHFWWIFILCFSMFFLWIIFFTKHWLLGPFQACVLSPTTKSEKKVRSILEGFCDNSNRQVCIPFRYNYITGWTTLKNAKSYWLMFYCLFESMIRIVFQNVFNLEMHQNNVFFLKKIIFDINTSKR